MRVFSAFGKTLDTAGDSSSARGLTLATKQALWESSYGVQPTGQEQPVPAVVGDGSPPAGLGVSLPVMLGIGAVGLYLLFGRHGG